MGADSNIRPGSPSPAGGLAHAIGSDDVGGAGGGSLSGLEDALAIASARCAASTCDDPGGRGGGTCRAKAGASRAHMTARKSDSSLGLPGLTGFGSNPTSGPTLARRGVVK